MTVGWLAAAVAGRVVSGDPDQVVGNIVTDSRSLQEGDFFIALRGARFDGHEFVGEACKRGAMGVIVEAGRKADLKVRLYEEPRTDKSSLYDEQQTVNSNVEADLQVRQPVMIEVGDTTVALQDLANAVREATENKVIAITGSAGKTTTKDTIADLLSESY